MSHKIPTTHDSQKASASIRALATDCLCVLTFLLMFNATAPAVAGTCKDGDCSYSSSAGTISIGTQGSKLDDINLLFFDEDGNPQQELDIKNKTAASCTFKSGPYCDGSPGSWFGSCLNGGCDTTGGGNRTYTFRSTLVATDVIRVTTDSLLAYARGDDSTDLSVGWDGGERGFVSDGGFQPRSQSDFFVEQILDGTDLGMERHIFPLSGEYKVERCFTTGNCDCSNQCTSATLLVSWPTPGGTIGWADGASDSRTACGPTGVDSVLSSESPFVLNSSVVEVSWESYRDTSAIVAVGDNDVGKWFAIAGASELTLSVSALQGRLAEFIDSPSAGKTVQFRRVFHDRLRDETTYSNTVSVQLTGNDDEMPTIQNKSQAVCSLVDLQLMQIDLPARCTGGAGSTTYQWMRFTPLDPVPEIISGAVSSTYKPNSLPEGLPVFFNCVVSCTIGGSTCDFLSETAMLFFQPGAGLVYYPDFDFDGFPDLNGEPIESCLGTPEGYAHESLEADCFPALSRNFPGQRWYIDFDFDGAPDEESEIVSCTTPPDHPSGRDYKPLAEFAIQEFDCNDQDPAVTPAQIWYLDADEDGYPEGTTLERCERTGGYRLASELASTIEIDCDDADPEINPETVWVADADMDGYGNDAAPLSTGCERPQSGFLLSELLGSDCDDTTEAITAAQPWYRDLDLDGYPAAEVEGGDVPWTSVQCGPGGGFDFQPADLVTIDEVDCDDNIRRRRPDQRWYPDADGDGRGDSMSTGYVACLPVNESDVVNHLDCDDSNSDPEACAPFTDPGNALAFGDNTAALKVRDSSRFLVVADRDFSISLWLSVLPDSFEQFVMSKGHPCRGADVNQFWALTVTPSGDVRFQIQTLSTNHVEILSQTPINDGGWHHVVVRREGDELTIWLDGQLDAVVISSLVHSVEVTEPVRFGAPALDAGDAPSDSCGSGFSGSLDEVSFWGIALREISIQLEDFHTLRTGEPGAVAYWQFNESPQEPDTAFDLIGGGHATALGSVERVTSGAPIGLGITQRRIVDLRFSWPRIDFVPIIGVDIVSPQLSGELGTVLEVTRLDAMPVGTLPPVAAGDLFPSYWIVEDRGPDQLTMGSLSVELGDGLITPELVENPSAMRLFGRTSRTNGPWTLRSVGTQAVTQGEVTFGPGDVTGQLAVVIGDPSDVFGLLRGDCNGDGGVDISDGIFHLNSLFVLGSEQTDCLEACNSNDDDASDISDAIFTFNFLFVAGSETIPSPYPVCGPDPAIAMSLGCERFGCE